LRISGNKPVELPTKPVELDACHQNNLISLPESLKSWNITLEVQALAFLPMDAVWNYSNFLNDIRASCGRRLVLQVTATYYLRFVTYWRCGSIIHGAQKT